MGLVSYFGGEGSSFSGEMCWPSFPISRLAISASSSPISFGIWGSRGLEVIFLMWEVVKSSWGMVSMS